MSFMIHPLIFFHAMNSQWSGGPYDLSTHHLIFAARSKWMLALCSLRGNDLCVRYCLHLLSLFNKRSLLELVRFAFRPRKDTPNPIPVHSSAFAGVPVWLCMFKKWKIKPDCRDKDVLLECMFSLFSSTKCQYRFT